MSLSAIRSSLNTGRILLSRRTLFNSVPKTFSVNQQNSRAITRSLFYLSGNRDSDTLRPSAVSMNSNCACGMHTKGDQELASFLNDEIKTESASQTTYDVSKLEGFEVEFSSAEVTLSKKMDKETILIKANVNNSVDAEETVLDPNDAKEQQEETTEMKAKPEFSIEIKKGKKTLSFHCTFTHTSPEDEPGTEAYNDVFQISEVSLYEGEFEDSTYTVSGDIMDGYLYDLLMNYLEERGISNDLADKMGAMFTSYEHQLYINLLKGMKSFVEK